MIGVEIVEPHGGLAHQHLTGAGLAERHFAPVDDLGAALRLDKGLGRLHVMLSCCCADLGRGGGWCKGRAAIGLVIARSRRRRGNLQLSALCEADSWRLLPPDSAGVRSEEHTSVLQSLMRISYAVFCVEYKQ